MARYNPLIFPDPEYVQEFTPPPAADGTVIGKTWYWIPASSTQDAGHWELRTPEIKEMTWKARAPMMVRRKTRVTQMNVDDSDFNPYADTIVYYLEYKSLDSTSYSYDYSVDWDTTTEVFVINGYHAPRLVLTRGNKYTFRYSGAYEKGGYEMFFHKEIRRDEKMAFNLYEEGVKRDDSEKSVTFTVPGDAPPKLLYGPQPDLFLPGRTGEIAIEDHLRL